MQYLTYLLLQRNYVNISLKAFYAFIFKRSLFAVEFLNLSVFGCIKSLFFYVLQIKYLLSAQSLLVLNELLNSCFLL